MMLFQMFFERRAGGLGAPLRILCPLDELFVIERRQNGLPSEAYHALRVQTRGDCELLGQSLSNPAARGRAGMCGVHGS
jgi:hypothetical protein